MAQLPEGDFADRAEVVTAIALTGDDRALPLLDALSDGELHVRKADGAILRVTGRVEAASRASTR